MFLHTKIIATIGPQSDSKKVIAEMYKSGMRIARLNFSHGDYKYFKRVINNIRYVSKEIAILLDTKGPEIRSGEVEGQSILLKDNQDLVLTSKPVLGTSEILTINYSHLLSLNVGDKVLIDDGLIETKVTSKQGDKLKVKVLNGGTLGSRKTVSLRGHNANLKFLSEKDKKDIDFAIENNLDFIAASFVRNKTEVQSIRKYLEGKESKIRVISKIEHYKALENINEIIEVSQGIMVARGDLGVEVEMEKVPKIQKDIIRRCNELGKPVIVATQMLESMKSSPRPTRAEIADVAQAILDGTDAIMLSGETAMGKYPVKSVQMMAKIAREYEKDVMSQIMDNLHTKKELKRNSISMFITRAAAEACKLMEISSIITPTESGFTARKVSRFKPKSKIIATTSSMTVFRQLQLSWGVHPIYFEKKYLVVDEMVYGLIKHIYDLKLLKLNDRVAVTSGHTLSKAGHTNSLELFNVKVVIKKFNLK